MNATGSMGLLLLLLALCPASASAAAEPDGQPAKSVLKAAETGGNLLKPDAWGPWQKGFERQGDLFHCANASDATVQRGASQAVELNQAAPRPIVAMAWSRANGVGGSPDGDYALYLDLVYADGTPLWGQTAPFRVGTHDWQRVQVTVFPEKPVKSVAVHLLLRRHTGEAWFRDPVLREVATPEGACMFDGLPVALHGAVGEGFQVRDVAADSDFVRIEREALGLKLEATRTEEQGATFVDLTLTEATGKDRAVTLLYAIPIEGEGWQWLADPRGAEKVEPRREYMNAGQFRVGANGRLSRYPFAAVAEGARGVALGIDMAFPAFFRVGYNGGSRELFLAWDIGLAPQKPSARLRLVRFGFEPAWGFRAALARYYELFPDAFRSRTPEQGLWMPFAKISAVRGWEDFGFKFKEGNNETKWDDAHGIVTFRYTEPMTWWMKMPTEMPRTLEAALGEARRLADKGDARARAFLSSGFHNEDGQFAARLLDTPWCNGAVWSVNDMPGIKGDVTGFSVKWNPELREKLYGPKRDGDLDGEYIDSSECYVTDDLDFRRDHFAAADAPLAFSFGSHKPGIFKELAVFEYVRGIARDVHAMGKLMMANGAPTRLCWLVPMLEVCGTETDWNRSGQWRPMSDGELLYRRALCRAKPYCFLMNTRFEDFPSTLVEKYMKRSLAYGMFPGFFSHNASQGQYFTRPELYDRDRPLFKKYVPLCRLVAEAGWEPVTLAHSSDPKVHVERFGEKYLTVFNDSSEPRTATITFEGKPPASLRELVRGVPIELRDGKATLTLDGEDVAVLDLH